MEPSSNGGVAVKGDRELRRRLEQYERRMHPSYSLRFDGRELALQENGTAIVTWPAVSGRDEMQGPEYQSYRDHGPLPQGRYRFKVSELQRYDDLSAVQKIVGPIGRGEWKGGVPAWGKHRFWLTPAENTRTFGRDNFSIHGGWVPGSAGCIDLTDQMDEFTDLMQALGSDEVEVQVDYGWDGPPNHRRR